MRVDDVRYVLAVIKHGTLSAAAQELFVSKPGLSEAIRRVESDLGVQLFERSSRGMTLTPAGEQLKPHLHASLKVDDDLRNAARAAARSEDATSVVVGTLLGFGASWIDEAAQSERSSSPPLDIHVEVAGWSDVTGGLLTGAADASLIAGPTDHDEVLNSWTFGHDTRVAVMAQRNPLAKCETVTIEQLDAAGWIVPALELRLDAAWYNYWGAVPERPNQALPDRLYECQDPAQMIVAARANKGVFTTLAGVGDQFALSELAIRPVADLAPCPIRLCYHGAQPTAQVQRIVTTLGLIVARHLSHPA